MPQAQRRKQANMIELNNLDRDDLVKYAESLEEKILTMQEEDHISDAPVEDVLKSADPEVIAIVKDMEARMARAEALAKAEQDARLEREFIDKASSFDHLPGTPEQLGRLLKSLAEQLDEDTFTGITAFIDSINGSIGKSGLWNEIGSSSDSEGSDEIDSLAKAYQNEHSVSYEQAYVKVLESNPGLYK